MELNPQLEIQEIHLQPDELKWECDIKALVNGNRLKHIACISWLVATSLPIVGYSGSGYLKPNYCYCKNLKLFLKNSNFEIQLKKRAVVAVISYATSRKIKLHIKWLFHLCANSTLMIYLFICIMSLV